MVKPVWSRFLGAVCHVRPIAMLLMLLFGVNTIHGAGSPATMDFDRLDRQLWEIITNTNSALSDVKQAIEHLGAVKEKAIQWRKVADDLSYSPAHRQMCIMALFKRHYREKGSVVDLALALDKATWLREVEIHKLGVLSGYIPIKNLAKGDVFILSILPQVEGKIATVYVQVNGEMDFWEFSKILREGVRLPTENHLIWDYGFFEHP